MDNKYSGPDRRKFRRVKANFIVIYKINHPLEMRMMLGDNEVHAVMFNLSENGVALLTNYNIPSSTLLSMKFILINDNAISDAERIKQIKVNGEVRYSMRSERGECRLGIRFTDTSEADQRTIANFVRMQVGPGTAA